jgi:long-chain acyl-CoA synthetase
MISSSLPELFIKQSNKNGKKIAFEYRLRRNEPYRTISWERLHTLVFSAAYGLIELGLGKGDKIAIISDTRYEWAVCDLACMCAGGVVVPIYPTLPSESVAYIINNSGCEIVIVENKGQLQKIRSQWDKLPTIKYAIVIEDLGDIPQYDRKIITFDKLKDKGKLNFSRDPYLIQKSIENINVDDIATIIYTSGTTGPPKGVMLTHKNILSVLEVLPEILQLKNGDKFLSFLPLSHVFERVGGLYYAVSIPIPISFCSSVDQIANSLRDSNATIMLVVPRILEKIHTKIMSQIRTLPDLKKKLFDWSISAGTEYVKLKYGTSSNINPFLFLILLIKHKIANILVFKQLRKKLAPSLKCFISGGAPLSKEIAEFFTAIGFNLLQGYGLTETSAPATVNTAKNNKIGTVGKPLPNVQIKISPDHEILIKGPTVFSGYYKNENATNEAIKDEWFFTGDIGFVDEDGFLTITDRKKDIIVSSSGKNIAPQNIENSIKTSHYISNVVVVGDNRKYLSALITLDKSQIIEFANKHNVYISNGFEDFCKNPEIIKLVDEEIKYKTSGFADYEQIRKFTILPNDFTVENGEVTPTLKVKRKYIQEKYKSLIDSMYPQE